jgi:hypothetical protein
MGSSDTGLQHIGIPISQLHHQIAQVLRSGSLDSLFLSDLAILPKLVLTPHILNVKRWYSKQSYNFVEKKRKLEKPWAVASSCLAWGLR